MMRQALFLLLPLMATICRAQSSDTIPEASAGCASKTPYDPQCDHHTWSLKGKVLPIPLGNRMDYSTLLGVEYGISRRSSVGIDGSFYYSADRFDEAVDTAGVVHIDANESHGIERAIYLNYRYYLDLHKWRVQQGLAVYISALARYGRFTGHEDPSFANNFITQELTDRSAGLVVGVFLPLSVNRRFGIDFNLGAMYREQFIESVYPDQGGTRNETESSYGIIPRMGLNLEYWFSRKTRR